MKPLKEDAIELAKAARKKLQRNGVLLEYIEYDNTQGHVWLVRDETTHIRLAHGWFGANGNPRFSLFKNNK